MFNDLSSRPSNEVSISISKTIKDSVGIFEQQLRNKWDRQKIPKGMKKKFQQTRIADATGTSRIFFDNGGLKAWIAYFLATEGKAHFKGRRDRSVTIAAFQQLPAADRVNVAKAVAGKKPHPSVRDAIHTISGSFKDAGILNTRLNEYAHQRPSPAESLTGDANVSSQNNISSTPKNSLDTGASQHLVFENASLLGIADVFDQYMCGAIRKDTVLSDGAICLKAAITMDFPIDGLVDCLMSLAIYHTKVEYLAMSLFNVHVESAGQVRYVVLNEGAKLLPSPEITLKGALDESIIRILGPEIHGAIQSSRMRRKEMEEGNHVTECVSMILTSRPEEGAIINLSLGLKGGTNLKNKLYT